MGIERITSAQNPKIKELLALQEKSRLRRERGLFVVEGRREVEHCLGESGFASAAVAGEDNVSDVFCVVSFQRFSS